MSNHNSIWWGPPGKFEERQSERKISWLELFYDLVYVVVLAQLTEHLAEDICLKELGHFFFLFIIIFWSWLNGSYYHDMHGNSGVRTRYFTLLQMLAVSAVAITLKDNFHGLHQGFAISFTIVQCIINYLWWSVGFYDPSHKVLNRGYRIYYSIASVLFFISIFVDQFWAYILWGFALIFNYGVVFFTRRSTEKELAKRGMVYSSSYSIIERYGLFTMIVLGENIFGIIHGLSEIEHKSVSIWLAFLLAILIVFLLWWIYFDMLTESTTKKGYIYFLLLAFLNIPLLASFAASGSSIRMILASEGNNFDSAWIYCLCIAIILFLIAAMSNIMEHEKEEEKVMKGLSKILIITALCLLAITPFIIKLMMVPFLAVITLVLIIPVIIGTRIWVKFILFIHNEDSPAG